MGHHNHHFSGDLYSNTGFWGTPTSAANFCEEDYAVTIYIAEFINCLTNLAYIYYSLKYAFKPGRGQTWSGHDFMSASLFIVGIASSVYHATLRQTMQLFDDLSMLLLGASFLLSVYTANQTPMVRYFLATVICSSITAVSIIYLRSGNILLHTYSFVTILMLTWPRILYLIRSKPVLKADRPHLDKHRPALASRLAKAGGFLVVAFILWNIDLEMCLEFRSLRKRIGLPWAWFLELHGWWHILTAVAAFKFMELSRDICSRGG